MAVYKNKASQKVACFAYDSTDGSAKTGDAANITAELSKDGGASAATNDVNPTELDATDHPGIYIFDLTQSETNADMVIVSAVSATSNILIEPLIIYTEPEIRDANVTQISDSTTAADNAEIVYDTDFVTNYNATRNAWATNVQDFVGTSASDPFNGQVVAASVTGAINTAAGTITTLDALDTAQDSQHSTTQSAISGLNNPTTEAIADAVWDEAVSGHSTASTFGKSVSDILEDTKDLQTDWADGGRLDLILDSILVDTSTTIPAMFPANLSALGINVSGHLSRVTLVDTTTANTDMRGTDGAYTGTPPTESAIADAVLNEALSDHTTAGTLGKAIGDGVTAWVTATSVTVSDKTGFKLSSDGLDSISITSPSGVASNFREMLVQLWRRFFKRVVDDKDNDTIKTYADDGTTAITTQNYTSDSSSDDVGAAT